MVRVIQIIWMTFVLLMAAGYATAQDSAEVPVQFDIIKYQIEGNTLIHPVCLDRILAPYTGSKKDIKTIHQARAALEKAYRQRGFAAVRVSAPEQVVEKGIVRLKVKEPVVGEVKIEGNRFFDEANIFVSLPALRKGEPLNTRSLATNIKLVNESPAKQVQVQLQQHEQDETIRATIGVQDQKSWKASLSLGNTGDDNTGKFRTGVLLQHANLFNRDHLLSLQYITSPTKVDKVGIYGAGYRLPIYPLAASVDLIGVYSDVSSGSVEVGGTSMQIKGKGTTLGFHYNQNLAAVGSYEHKLTAGLDYRAYVNDVDWQGNQLGNDVTVHPLSLTYAGNITLRKFGAGFYLGVSYNLPGGWAANDERDDFERARLGARQDYTILRFGGNLMWPFYGDWQVRAAFNSQYASTPLVAGEQFSVGGVGSVRGFYPSQVSNDNGYTVSAEMITPDIMNLLHVKKVQCRALAFYDRGYVSRINPLPGEIDSATISSAGLGLRVTDGKYVSASLDYGWVIDTLNGVKSRGDGLLHFMIIASY